MKTLKIVNTGTPDVSYAQNVNIKDCEENNSQPICIFRSDMMHVLIMCGNYVDINSIICFTILTPSIS